MDDSFSSKALVAIVGAIVGAMLAAYVSLLFKKREERVKLASEVAIFFQNITQHLRKMHSLLGERQVFCNPPDSYLTIEKFNSVSEDFIHASFALKLPYRVRYIFDDDDFEVSKKLLDLIGSQTEIQRNMIVLNNTMKQYDKTEWSQHRSTIDNQIIFTMNRSSILVKEMFEKSCAHEIVWPTFRKYLKPLWALLNRINPTTEGGFLTTKCTPAIIKAR